MEDSGGGVELLRIIPYTIYNIIVYSFSGFLSINLWMDRITYSLKMYIYHYYTVEYIDHWCLYLGTDPKIGLPNINLICLLRLYIVPYINTSTVVCDIVILNNLKDSYREGRNFLVYFTTVRSHYISKVTKICWNINHWFI